MANNSFLIKNSATLNPQSSIPANPVDGDVYYDASVGTFVFYDNGNWINLASRVDVPSATNLTSTNLTSAVVQNSLIRITGSTAFNLCGLTASADGKQVLIYNESSASGVIEYQSGTESTATNRIITNTGANISLSAGAMITFVYDASQMRWISSPPVSTGNIQNLPSTPDGGAGIYWENAQSTFQFLGDNGTSPANIDTGSLIVRYPGSYPTPSGNYIILNAPSSLASGYSLYLPSIPSQLSFLTLDTSGNIGTASNVSATQIAPFSITGGQIASSTIQQSNMAILTPVNFGSNATGQTTTSATPGALVVQGSITTSGGAVMIVPKSGYFSLFNSLPDPATATFTWTNNSGDIYFCEWGGYTVTTGHTLAVPVSIVLALDTTVVGTPGTYTYTLYVSVNAAGGTTTIDWTNLLFALVEL